MEALDVVGYYENGYKTKSTYTVYDPYSIGYQKLMNGSEYFSTGWHLSIYTDTSKASAYTINGTINYRDNIIGLAFIFIKYIVSNMIFKFLLLYKEDKNYG